MIHRLYHISLGEIKSLESIYSDRKQRFDSSIILGAARRCKFNHVQVIICAPVSCNHDPLQAPRLFRGYDPLPTSPLTGGGERTIRPFPTSFWLTCPYLTRLAGMIESRGGVSEHQDYIRSQGLIHDWTLYNVMHQSIRSSLLDKNLRGFMMSNYPALFRGLMHGGVGGTKYKAGEVNAKCLHLQTASFMALGFHPAGKWLKSKSLWGSCDNNACGQCKRLSPCLSRV